MCRGVLHPPILKKLYPLVLHNFFGTLLHKQGEHLTAQLRWATAQLLATEHSFNKYNAISLESRNSVTQ